MNQQPDRKALIVLGLVSLALMAYVIAGVMEGRAEASDHGTPVMDASDVKYPEKPRVVGATEKQLGRLLEFSQESQRDAASDEVCAEDEYLYQNWDSEGYSGSQADYSGFPDEAAYNSLYNDNGPTRYMPGYANGHVETYYSSNVLYHNRTGEWEVDDEGFYHDPETGYYIVGVSTQEWYGDRPEGTVIDTGKGKAIVCDNGWTAEPTVDFYTNW